MGLTSNTGFYNRAADIYGVDDLVMLKIPRSKFNFNLLVYIDPAIDLGAASINPNPIIYERVSTVSLPDYNYGTQTLNQYNRKRLVHVNHNVNPLTVMFYDTKDNQWQDIMKAYAKHYFHGHELDPRTMLANDTTTSNFDGVFGAKAVPVGQKYFFPKIEVVSIDAKDTDGSSYARSIQMFNCYITDVSHDNLSYADSSPIQWSVRFQPEHINLLST